MSVAVFLEMTEVMGLPGKNRQTAKNLKEDMNEIKSRGELL